MSAAAPPAERRPDRPRRAAALQLRRHAATPAIAGDTLASALLANGVRLVGRSFKYHRPRGMLSRRRRGAERAGRTARRRAARAQHPRDDGRALRRARGAEPEPLAVAALRRAGASTSLPRRSSSAGFYYKTFMWPAAFWEKVYEPLIRRAAGLGQRQRASPIPTLREGAPPSATCWSSAPARRA